MRRRRHRAAVIPIFMKMQVHDQKLESVDINSVEPHPRNPRRGDVQAIAESIHINGFYGAIVVQKSSRYIIAGNHRWLVSKQMGAKEIPALIVDVTDEEALRILLADNRVAQLGSFAEDELSQLLESIGELAGTGYTPQDAPGAESDEALQSIAEGEGGARATAKRIKLGDEDILVTMAELERLIALLERYKSERGTAYGFMTWIMDGGAVV